MRHLILLVVLALVLLLVVGNAQENGEEPWQDINWPTHLWQNWSDMPDDALAAWLDYVAWNGGVLWLPSTDVMGGLLDIWGFTGDFEAVQLHAEFLIVPPQTWEEYDELVELLEETLNGKTPLEADFSLWSAHLWVLSYQDASGQNIGFCQWAQPKAEEFHCYLFTEEGNIEVTWKELASRRGK